MAPLTRSLVLLALLAIPAVATAQARGLPIFNSGLRSGGGISADLGLGNDASGTGTTLGLTASTGLGFIGLSGGISRGSSGGAEVWAQGVAIAFQLLGGPMAPFRVSLLGGVGHWSQGVVETVRLPLSLGIAAVIPNPAFGIRPWLAPRVDYQGTTFENSDLGRTAFGLSGGIELEFLNGITVRSAYDRVFVDGDPGILSFGVGLALGR
jgi:hypothetical protein